MNDPLYTADALEGRLTETGRLALLHWCVKQAPVTHESDALLSWAVCQADADKLDPKKLTAELESEPAGARFYIRINAVKMQQQLAQRAAEKKALLAKDASGWQAVRGRVQGARRVGEHDPIPGERGPWMAALTVFRLTELNTTTPGPSRTCRPSVAGRGTSRCTAPALAAW